MSRRLYKPPRLRAPGWPRISLVTAVFNGAAFLESTIRSVLDQRYPNLEYIVIDGGSTDGSLDIIRKYESQISFWMSEPDEGVYDALNKGFARSSGEILGWLNSSDMLQVNGLHVVGSVFGAFHQIEWITGRPTKYNAAGMTVSVFPLPRWSRLRFLAGANKYIQQESTFWRRGLWEKAGASLSTAYRAEGDFELWVRFFRHAQLYSVDALIGGYRAHENALSSADMPRYDRNCDEISDRELAGIRGNRLAKLFRGISRAVKPIPKVRGAWQRLALRALYTRPGRDWPPVIAESDGDWAMRNRARP